MVRWIRNHYPVTDKLEGGRFFVMRNGVRMATPLLLALVLVSLAVVASLLAISVLASLWHTRQKQRV